MQLRLSMVLVACLASAPPLAAQSGEKKPPDATRLDALLAELSRVPPEIWQQRVAAMKRSASEKRAEAKRLRTEAKALAARATAAEKSAAAIDGEIQHVEGLRAALAKIVFRATQPKPATGPEPMATARPKESAKPKSAPNAKPKPTPKTMPTPAASATPSKPAAAQSKPQPGGLLLTYDDHVLPILEENCTTCHDAVDASGGLDASSFAAVVQGGGSGRTLKPGQPEESRLYMLVARKEKPTMPPDEPPIPSEQIETIRKWIEQGAPENAEHAARLAAERNKAASAAAAAAAAAAKERPGAVAVVMPEALPRVPKALPPRPPAMRAIAASPSAPLLAVPGHGQVLLLGADLADLGVLEFPFGTVEVLDFTADGARLLAAGGSPGERGGAVVWDVRTGAEVGRYGEGADSVLAAAISPGGTLVAVGGTTRRVDVYEIDGGARRYRVGHDDWVLCADFSADGTLLATGDRVGNVLVTEADTGRDAHTLRAHEGAVHAVCFRPDAEVLASAGADRAICAWRMKDGRRLTRATDHRDDVLCLDWASRLASADADGRVIVWGSNGRPDGKSVGLDEWVYGVAFVADGSRLIAADWQGRLSSVDVVRRKVTGAVVPLAIRP